MGGGGGGGDGSSKRDREGESRKRGKKQDTTQKEDASEVDVTKEEEEEEQESEQDPVELKLKAPTKKLDDSSLPIATNHNATGDDKQKRKANSSKGRATPKHYIFAGNLPPNIKENKVKFFQADGVEIFNPHCYAHICFSTVEAALKAFRFNGHKLMGYEVVLELSMHK
uniref:RRM domain-containing protein n=1 Tax=Oryza punctata TaxID=4537 RepID=A0A0E0LV29_ORYPU